MALPKTCIPKTILRGQSSAWPRSDLTRLYFGRGFTLIEIMVVMCLLAIVGSLGLFMSLDGWRGDTFRDNEAALIGGLRRARAQAVNNICLGTVCGDGQPHGIHFEPGGFVIFQGAAYHGSPYDAAVDEEVEFSGGDFLASTPSDIVFEQLSGGLDNASSTIKVMIVGSNHNSTISINPAGQIDCTN